MTRFTIELDKDGYRARLWSGSDLIWWTEGYERKEGAQRHPDRQGVPQRPRERPHATGGVEEEWRARGYPRARALVSPVL